MRYYLEFIFYAAVLGFYIMSFFKIRDPIQKTTTHNPHVSLGSFWLWQFLRLGSSWWPFQFWGILTRSFVECSQLGYVWFLLIGVVLWVLRGRAQNGSAIFITWYHGQMLSIDSSLLVLTVMAGWGVSVRFFHFWVILSLLHTGLSGRTPLSTAHSRTRVCAPPPWGRVSPQVVWYSTQEICLSSPALKFIHLFISM